jgi:PAS domain S-box-containing protein
MKTKNKRKPASRKARASVEKPASLENFVDIAFDAIIGLDAQGRINFWNAAAERIYGWTADEVLGRTQAEIAATRTPVGEPATQDPSAEERRARIARGETFHAEQKTRRKDGSPLWVEYTARAIFDRDGAISGFITSSRDITERKQAQQALTEFARQQEALYKFTDQLHRTNSLEDIFNAALDGIINALGCDRASILLFDEAGIMRFVAWRGLSDEYRRITDGHSPWKQHEKFPLPICVNDVPSADFGDDLKDTIQREGISSLAFIPLDTSKSLIGKFMVYYNEPHTFTTSEVELSLTLARQLAFGVERKRSEEKLRTSEALYRAIVRSIPGSGVYVVNKDMRYIVAEGVVSEAFGLSREILEGHTLSEIFNEEITARMQERFRRNFAGETISYEIKRDDSVYWIQQAPLIDSMGDALVVTMDITGHKRVEEALRASEERYRNLFASVPIAVYTCDSNGVIKEFNQRSVELWGRLPDPSDRYSGACKLYHPDGTFMPHEQCPMGRVLHGETLEPHECEIILEQPNGRRRNVIAHPKVLKNEAGEVIEAINCLYDITEERQAEKRATLLVQVGEMIREMTDPDEFLYAVSQAVGDHLMVQRTLFAEIDQANDRGFIRRDYCRGVSSMAGEYRLSDYSNENEQYMKLGHKVVNRDSKLDLRTAAYYEKTYGPNGERAYVAVPLMRDGTWVAVLWVSMDTPRDWSDEEVALLETVAERAWLATEKMRLNHALRQSEERFVRFMQHLPGLAWIKDMQGRYVYANATAQQAFNIPEDKLYGSTDNDIFPPETAAQFRQNDRLALEDGKGIQIVETLKQEDGVVHHSLVSKFPIPGLDGKSTLVGGTAFDITERKQAEEALRVSEERFRTLANAAPSIVWTAAPDGTITYSNEHWYRYTGISPEDAQNWARLVLHPDDYERCVQEWRRAVETQPDEYLIEIRNRRHDGEYRWFQTRAIPVRDDHGVVTGWYGVTTDIHDRIEAENALLENQTELKALNETLEQRVQQRTAEVRSLASDLTKAEQRERHRIAHILHDDLQQRLYAIKMHVGLLKNKLDTENAKLMYDLADVKEQLDDVIVVTRQLSVDMSPPILRDEGLAHAIGWLASQMKEQHGLQVELQADEPFIIPDEDLQVLLFNCVRELLFNIVKHAGVNRGLVALQRSDTDLQIVVRDDGKGFHVNRAVELVTGSVENQYRKSSFGIPTLRHRISVLGGRMDINSMPGSGTHITLTIPVYSREAGPIQ